MKIFRRFLLRLPIALWAWLLYLAAMLPSPLPYKGLGNLRIAAGAIMSGLKWRAVLRRIRTLPKARRPAVDPSNASGWRSGLLASTPHAFRHRSWQQCIAWRNLEGLEVFRRGAVVAFCHLHGQRLLLALLRAHGIDAAMLTARPMQPRDRWLLPRRSLREFLRGSELGGAVRHLQGGGVLMVALEGTRTDNAPVPVPGGVIPSSSGIFRLARLTQRPAVPAVVMERRPWDFEVVVGPPLLQPPAGTPDAAVVEFNARLWEFFWPHIWEAPRQWPAYFVNLMMPLLESRCIDSPGRWHDREALQTR